MTSLSTLSLERLTMKTYSVTYWEYVRSIGRDISGFVIVEASGVEDAFKKAANLLEGKSYTFGCANEKN